MAQSGGECKKVLNTILFMQHNVSIIVVPGVLIVGMVQRKISRKKKTMEWWARERRQTPFCTSLNTWKRLTCQRSVRNSSASSLPHASPLLFACLFFFYTDIIFSEGCLFPCVRLHGWVIVTGLCQPWWNYSLKRWQCRHLQWVY